jgi:hypothetical protein
VVEDERGALVRDCGPLAFDGSADGCRGGISGERANIRVVEQSFGVRLCLSGERGQLREACAEDQERQSFLTDTVDRYNECRSVLCGQILDLVDEQRRPPWPPGRLGDCEQDFRQVRLEVTRVSASSFRFDTELNVANRDLDRARERAKDGESSARDVLPCSARISLHNVARRGCMSMSARRWPSGASKAIVSYPARGSAPRSFRRPEGPATSASGPTCRASPVASPDPPLAGWRRGRRVLAVECPPRVRTG